MSRRSKRGGQVNVPFTDSAVLNNATYNAYLDRMTQLAITRYCMEGEFPGTVNQRFMERTLCLQGSGVMFRDPVLGFLFLPWRLVGRLDLYNDPATYRAYANNGYQSELLTPDNSVVFYNNYLKTSDLPQLQLYAWRLYCLERAIDVNINAQKTPILLLCDESQRLTLENLYMKYDGNQPFIFGTKALETSTIEALKTDAPFVADKLEAQKQTIWNEAMTYLGIGSINEKKERRVSSEVSYAMGGTLASEDVGLSARKDALERCKTLWPDVFGNVEYVARNSYGDGDADEPDGEEEGVTGNE